VKLAFALWLEQDQWFHNKKHLEQELNQKLNTTVLKGLNPQNLHYVVIDDKKHAAEVYLGNYGDIPEATKKKLIQAVKFFLQDMGVQIGAEKIDAYDKDILLVPIFDFPRYTPEPGQWKHLNNPELQRRLHSGETLDVTDLGIEIEPGVWKLNKFIDGAEYYDSKNKRWIISIGKDKATGDIYASSDGRFYDSKGQEDFPYETLWLQ